MASVSGAAIQSAASSGISYALNAALPGLGTAFGIASSVFGGFFGGGQQRQSISAIVAPAQTGSLYVRKTGQKNSTTQTAQQFGDAVIAGLKSIEDQTGFKVTKSYNVEANIGAKDAGTFLNNKRVSTTGGDVSAAIKSILDDSSFDYKLLESKPVTQNSGSSNVSKNFVTSQAGIDPASSISSAALGNSSYMLLGLLILTIIIIKKG